MLSLSNILLLTSAFFTLATYLYPNIYVFGMNDEFLNQGNYLFYGIQFFTSLFLHGSLVHLWANSIFIYIFWNQIESLLGSKKYMIFFIISAVFIWSAITLFSDGNTIGMSGFAMALLSYYTLALRAENNPDYKWWITALVLNIGIGFMPGISLVWHLFGAIIGVIFYYWDTEFYKKYFLRD